MTVELHGYEYSVYSWITRLALHKKAVGYNWVEINPFADNVSPRPDLASLKLVENNEAVEHAHHRPLGKDRQLFEERHARRAVDAIYLQNTAPLLDKGRTATDIKISNTLAAVAACISSVISCLSWRVYLSSQTSSTRQPLKMLLTMTVYPLT